MAWFLHSNLNPMAITWRTHKTGVLARAAAGLLAATLVADGVLVVFEIARSWPGVHLLSLLAWYLFMAIPCALAACFIGWPLFVLVWHHNLVRWWTGAVGGLFVGVVVSTLVKAP
jgi:hypothetical protein